MGDTDRRPFLTTDAQLGPALCRRQVQPAAEDDWRGARALGWFVSRLDGTPVPYNQENPNHDEFLVCRPAAREKLLGALQRAGATRR